MENIKMAIDKSGILITEETNSTGDTSTQINQNITIIRAVVENLPARYQDKGFKNFVKSTPQLENFSNQCLDFAKLRNNKKCLFLSGAVGNGKTHLAVSVLKNLPNKETGITVNSYSGEAIKNIVARRSIFLVADEFFQELNDSFVKKLSKQDIINNYLNCYDMLCLDDLGIKNFTEAKRENLYLLINRAYLDDKMLIITTNFTIEQLKQIDERIASRLNEMALILLFTGKDYRKEISL